jgi:hypothetical protein
MPGLRRFLLVSALASAVTSSPVLAQSLTAEVTPTQVTTAPTLDNATAGIRANTTHEDLTAAEAAHRAVVSAGGGSSVGKGAIILLVGGAAIAGGILIGGAGGTALAIGGALVALYGIYLLLQ